MLELTNWLYQVPPDEDDPVAVVTAIWNSTADEIMAAAVKSATQDGTIDQYPNPVHFASADLFDTWLRLELGEGGKRALLWAKARDEGLRPSCYTACGSKDSRSDVAYAYVAEQLGMTGKDPVEAVRQSIARFIRRMRGTSAFIFVPSSCHIKFVSGNNVLQAIGVR